MIDGLTDRPKIVRFKKLLQGLFLFHLKLFFIFNFYFIFYFIFFFFFF